MNAGGLPIGVVLTPGQAHDVTAYPKITAALLKAGYSKDDIAKIWGGNALRVVREAQALAEMAQALQALVTQFQL